MTSLEGTPMGTLIDEVRGTRDDLRLLFIKIFGDQEGENTQGRLPRIEATILDHHIRLRRLERFTYLGQGIGLTLLGASAAIETLSYLHDLAKR
jgi:hypothetical protein